MEGGYERIVKDDGAIREYCSSISAKKISVMKLYKYLKDNIEGIE